MPALGHTGCRHQEVNDSLPRDTIGRESCSCRPTAILQIRTIKSVPMSPARQAIAFIFRAADLRFAAAGRRAARG